MCRSCLPSRSDEQGTKKEEEEERAFQIGSFVAYPIPPLLFPEKFSPLLSHVLHTYLYRSIRATASAAPNFVL